jgi:lipopolysaccharide/colanic/teichoic acid biosynthesis glycosyltransferase
VIKRTFDILVSISLIVMLAPLLLAIATIVRWRLGSPIIYAQKRPGLGERPFTMLKFRTMADANDSQGNPLPDADRLTPTGNRLRSWSLDELPELWNVARGDMSLVGPRPLLMEYLPLYNSYQRRRHAVRPGITGWAQVNGRNLVAWEDRFQMDIWYVENQNLWLDLKILYMTLARVINRDGISAEGEATMKVFKGTPE